MSDASELWRKATERYAESSPLREEAHRELEEIRKHLPGKNRTLGPSTVTEANAFRAHHRGWP